MDAFHTTVMGDAPQPAQDAAPQILKRGATIGRYVVLERIGAGGMGIVYAAFDPELDRRIALKLLHPRTRTKRPGVARARLIREAQALAQLSHPAVITVHDVGPFQDQVFVAMEFVDGVDLATWVAEEADSWEDILRAYVDAGGGLAAAHEAGIIHRDFKPDNVLVGHDGRVRVLDFGLARSENEEDADDALDEADRLEHEQESRGVAERDTSVLQPATQAKLKVVARGAARTTRLTQVGAVMGTPAYMAPEQHQGDRTDARSDQFSFCVALYESLYGERPYAGHTRAELMVRMLEGQVSQAPKDGPAVPAWIRKVLLRGLTIAPDERWPDMAALLAALSPKPKIKTGRLGLVAGVGLSAILGIVLATRSDPEVPCQGAQRKLAGVWDSGVRTTVQGAFDATRRPFAADAFATTSRFLDGYTQDWVLKFTEACQATAVRKEQSQELMDRQMACLGRRLKDVRALTRLLSEADAETVTHAVEATTKLPQLEPCMDAEFVMSGAAPLTGRRAEQATSIDEQMALAKQLEAFGRYPEALTAASESRAAAQVLQEPQRHALTTALVGRIQLRNGDAEEAEKTLMEAIWLADAAQTDHVRAQAWVTLVWAIGYELKRVDQVDALRRHAEAALQRAGGSALMSAQLHQNLGGIARRRQADPKRAVLEHERALEIFRAELGNASPRVATSLTNLGLVRAHVGEFEAAERDLDEAMQIFTDTLGDTHPTVAQALHTRGLIAFYRGGKERPVTLLRQAIGVQEAVLPADHPALATTVHDLGEVLLASEDHNSALPEFRRAAKLRRTVQGQGRSSLANSLTGVGRSLAGLGRQEEAIEILQEALQIHDALQSKSINRAETEGTLARLLADNDPARAKALALSAIAIFSAGGKTDDVQALEALLTSLRAEP